MVLDYLRIRTYVSYVLERQANIDGVYYDEKRFVIHEDGIDVFHNKFDIPTMGNLSFQLSHVRIIGTMEFGKTRNENFRDDIMFAYITDAMCCLQ